MLSRARVLIRVDAGMGIGYGHLNRCLALARCLTTRGVSVTFATRGHAPQNLRRIREVGAEYIQLPDPVSDELADGPVWDAERQRRDAQASLGGSHPKWDAVVVDHYRLDCHWERVARSSAARIVVIDDLANRLHDADVLVDHNWYGRDTGNRYAHLVPPGATLLLGPRYAMLHREYVEARLNRPPVQFPPARVMVSFGGTDVGRQTEEAVSALLSFPEFHVDAVVGTLDAVTTTLREQAEHPNVTLHVALRSLAHLMAKTDFAIGAGGTATWERICMGVPSIVTTVSENQSGVTRAFHEEGLTHWLGRASSVSSSDYKAALHDVLANPPSPVLPIVDGHGTERVGLAVVAPAGADLALRSADRYSVASVITAGSGGPGGPEVWRERLDTFQAGLETGHGPQLIMLSGIPVGVEFGDAASAASWIEPYLQRDELVGEAL